MKRSEAVFESSELMTALGQTNAQSTPEYRLTIGLCTQIILGLHLFLTMVTLIMSQYIVCYIRAISKCPNRLLFLTVVKWLTSNFTWQFVAGHKR